jgi:hypothetical protein
MHIHSLTADCRIFLRRRQVKDCLDLDQLVFQLTEKGNHLRQNMRGARDGIRQTLQRRQLASPISVKDSSDSEIEVVSITMAPKRKIKEEPDDTGDVLGDVFRHAQRPRLAPLVIPSSDLASGSSTPSLVSSSGSTPLTPSRSMPLTPSPLSSTPPISPITAFGLWPAGLYTVDMVEGFQKMDAASRRGLTMQDRFESVFKCPWHGSTYFDQRARWKKAMTSQRQAALDAGRTAAGKWSVFAASIPLKKK